MKACGLRRAFATGGMPGISAQGTLAAQQQIEADGSQIKFGNLQAQADHLNGSGGAGLSQRQKATALSQLQGDASKMGGAIDTGPQITGLSQRQQLGLDMAGIGHSSNIVDFGVKQQKDGLTASLADARWQRGFEKGGVPAAETPGEKLMREMAEKYGAPTGGPQPVPQPTPQPVSPPVQRPAQERGIFNLLKNRGAQIDKAVGYAKGGEVDADGFIHGPKGIDKVPAEVAETGEPILVGDGERIVNKKQNAALEKLAEKHGVDLDEYLEQATGEPVGPTLKKGLRAAEWGMEIGPDGKRTFTDIGRGTSIVPSTKPNWIPGGNPPSSGALPPPAQTTGVVPRSVNWAPGGNPPPTYPPAPYTGAGAGVSNVPSVIQQPTMSPAPAPQAPAPSAARVAGQTIGKVVKHAVPVIAAYNTVGDEGITVQGVRESDPGYDEMSGVDRLKAAAKEIGLRAGDWATTGLGYLGDWALPSGVAGFNEAYRNNMRSANFEGVTIPERGKRAAAVAPPAAPTEPESPMGKDRDTRSDLQRNFAAKQNDTELAGLRAAGQFFDPDTPMPKDMRFVRQNETNAPMAIWNTKHDAAAKTIGNMKDGSWIKPENGTGIVSIQQPNGSYKNVAIGQSEYTGIDGKPTSTYEGSMEHQRGLKDAANIKAQLRNIQRMNAERNMAADITDPAVKQAAAMTLMRMDKEDAAATAAAQHKEEMGLRKGMLDHHGRELDERTRQFNETLELQKAVAGAAAKKAGVADFDKLVSDAGFDEKEGVKFKDWFRGNYAGRRQKVGDQIVDVPGFEDMSDDERRAHMTNAKALYALTKQLNDGEMKGRTSMAVPKRMIERDITFDDVRRHQDGLFAGAPMLYSDDPNSPGLIGPGGLANRLWVPKWAGGKSKRVVEEVDENGKGLRRWLLENTRGEQGPWGNQDTAAFIRSITEQK